MITTPRMVAYSAQPGEWVVYGVPGNVRISAHANRDAAIGAAFADVKRNGGWLTVYDRDGALESHREFAPAAGPVTAAAQPATPVARRGPAPERASLAADLEDAVAKSDSVLSRALDFLSITGMLGTPLIAGLFTQEILEAAQGGTWALYFFSLTWSLGWTLVTIAFAYGLVRGGWGGVILAGLCFYASGYLAYELGVGQLDIGAPAGNPLLTLVNIATAAIGFYAPGGALVTMVLGAFLGWRIARHLPGSALNPKAA